MGKKKPTREGVVARTVTAFGTLTEDNTLNNGTAIINWWGTTAIGGANLQLYPLFDEEHKDACTRFKYFRVQECVMEVHIHDMIQISNESFSGSWGLGTLHIASDTNKANLAESANYNVICSRADYQNFPAKRGDKYVKRFNAQNYLRKHNPALAGWLPTDTDYKLGDVFYSAARLDTVNLAGDVPVATVHARVTIEYNVFKYNAV